MTDDDLFPLTLAAVLALGCALAYSVHGHEVESVYLGAASLVLWVLLFFEVTGGDLP